MANMQSEWAAKEGGGSEERLSRWGGGRKWGVSTSENVNGRLGWTGLGRSEPDAQGGAG